MWDGAFERLRGWGRTATLPSLLCDSFSIPLAANAANATKKSAFFWRFPVIPSAIATEFAGATVIADIVDITVSTSIADITVSTSIADITTGAYNAVALYIFAADIALIPSTDDTTADRETFNE
jgi:hypothetical protein